MTRQTFSPERLQHIRRLRKARRLFKQQPLFAYNIMSGSYEDYSLSDFLEDLRYRKPRKKKKGKKFLKTIWQIRPNDATYFQLRMYW